MWKILGIGAAAATAMISAFFAFPGSEAEGELKSDFTIYLEEPIAGNGGVIFIQPMAVDPDPDVMSELTTGTHSVRVSAQVSIVRIQSPSEGTYTYRFRPADENRYPGDTIKTGRIGVGSSRDFDPDGGDRREEIPTVLTHHFEAPGADWTTKQSRERRVNVPMGFLHERYDCVSQGPALVCDATSGDKRK